MARRLPYTRLSFARQFLIFSFLILVTGMTFLGFWVGGQIEAGVINRTAAVTALYVDSFISQYLDQSSAITELDPETLKSLDSLLMDTALKDRIVSFKVWSQDSRIIYSPNAELLGRSYPTTPPLQQAFNGEVHTEITDLEDAENEYEQERWDRLLETYAPVRAMGSDQIIAVTEFYQLTDELDSEIAVARRNSWFLVGVSTLLMYLLLVGLVGRANHTIQAQQSDLTDKIQELSTLLEQNEQLRAKVQSAAARTTEINEQFLRRIAADLHDSAAQDLSLALLRLEALAQKCAACAKEMGKEQFVAQDLQTVQSALETALSDVRSISSAVRMPSLESLELAEVVKKAIDAYEIKTGVKVAATINPCDISPSESVKITTYRLLQESLFNGFRHAPGSMQSVVIDLIDRELVIEVSDDGPGFDPNSNSSEEKLGIAGMKERVQILGGEFDIETSSSSGTKVWARIPLTPKESNGAQ